MEGKLLAASGSGAGREEMLRGDVVMVGRSSACQIVVQDEQVSRQHAELRRQGDQWVVRDAGSANGTFVNNRRLNPGESAVLRPGDRLRMGPRTEFDFAEASGVAGTAGYGAATAYPPPDAYGGMEQPVKRGVSVPVIIVAVVAVAALIAAAFFGYRAFSGKGTGGETAETGGAGETGALLTPGAVETVARVVVQEAPTALPAVAALPTVQVQPVKAPTVKAPAAKPAAQAGQQPKAAVAPNVSLEQMPAMIATAFPNVPASDLPAAIQGALQSGQVDPQMAQGFVGALFPGVAPAELPSALVGSFAGFSPDQIQGILGAIYPGQNLQMPQIRSGDGAVAYAAWEEGDQPNIYLLNADGSGKRLLVEGGSEPAFSPDGKQLAYFSWRDDAEGLRIRNMDTGEDRALTNSKDDFWPSWSPDGKRLVFYNWPDNVTVINADGTDRRGISQGQFPAWSPNGDRIAIKGCASSGCGIVLINPDGSNPAQITTNANDGQPAWSPDGRSMAFVSNRDGNWEIYAVNADGSWLRRITEDIHTDGLPAWASDGMRIAFRSDRTGTWAIYTATGVGGPAIKLVDAPVRGGENYAWDVETITWR